MTQTKAELLQTRHQGDIRLGDANSSHYVGFKAPATVGTSLVWTLPATDGSANQFLQTNASGVLGWGTADVSSAMPLTGGTFTGNVVYNDSVEARFGTGSDLKLYHNGSHSFIDDQGTGNLIIKSNTVRIMDSGGSEDMIQAIENGAVELYYDNAKKFETDASGAKITGRLKLDDNYKVSFGTDADLQIFHNATNSEIKNVTGVLYLESDNIWFTDKEGSDVYAKFVHDGAVELYHDTSKKFETTSAGIAITGAATVSTDLTVTGNLTVSGTTTTINTQTLDVEDKNVVIGKVSSPSDTTADGGGWTLKGASDKTFNWVNATDAWTSSEHIHLLDDKKLLLGTSSECTFFHDNAGQTYLTTSTGNFHIQCPAGENSIRAIPDGAVELYHNNNLRLATNADGFAVDNNAAQSTIYLKASGSTKGYIFAGAGNEIGFKTASNEWGVQVDSDAEVALYYDGSKKIETTTGGIDVTGAITVNGSALTSGIAAEFTAVADGAITANDPLSVTSAGKLKKSGEITLPFNFSFTSDTQATTSNTERYDCMADPHNSNRWAIIYTKDEHQNRNPRLRIITRSGSTLTTSSEYVAYGSTGTSAASSMGNGRVFWDVNRANRLCVLTTGEYSRTYGTLIEVSGSAGSESFSRIVESQQVSNEIGYYNQIYNGDPQVKHVGTGDNYLYVWKTSSGTSKYSIIRLLNNSIQVPIAQTAFWSEPCDNPPAFDMDPDNSGKGMATIVRNDSQSGTWYCRGFTVSNVNATDNSVSVNMHGPEGYVTSSSQTYDVDREYGSQIRTVASGHYVLSAFTAANTHGDNANRYKTIMKGIKWDGSNTYTKSSPYFFMPSQITNSAPNRYNHKLFNKPSDLTTIVVTEGWDGNSQNLVGYRVAVNTSANTLSFSTSYDSGFGRGSVQAADMQNEDNSTILWFREVSTSNASFRAIRGGGPGDDLNSFVGFATATVSDGNNVTAKTTGNTATQSGLSTGTLYYLQRNGTISTEAATPEVKVGVALSATSILVK